jgi:hypothetical protein
LHLFSYVFSLVRLPSPSPYLLPRTHARTHSYKVHHTAQARIMHRPPHHTKKCCVFFSHTSLVYRCTGRRYKQHCTLQYGLWQYHCAPITPHTSSNTPYTKNTLQNPPPPRVGTDRCINPPPHCLLSPPSSSCAPLRRCALPPRNTPPAITLARVPGPSPPRHQAKQQAIYQNLL